MQEYIHSRNINTPYKDIAYNMYMGHNGIVNT